MWPFKEKEPVTLYTLVPRYRANVEFNIGSTPPVALHEIKDGECFILVRSDFSKPDDIIIYLKSGKYQEEVGEYCSSRGWYCTNYINLRTMETEKGMIPSIVYRCRVNKIYAEVIRDGD